MRYFFLSSSIWPLFLEQGSILPPSSKALNHLFDWGRKRERWKEGTQRRQRQRGIGRKSINGRDFVVKNGRNCLWLRRRWAPLIFLFHIVVRPLIGTRTLYGTRRGSPFWKYRDGPMAISIRFPLLTRGHLIDGHLSLLLLLPLLDRSILLVWLGVLGVFRYRSLKKEPISHDRWAQECLGFYSAPPYSTASTATLYLVLFLVEELSVFSTERP